MRSLRNVDADEGAEHGASRAPKTKGVIRRNITPLLENDWVRSVRERFGVEADDSGSHDAPEEDAPAGSDGSDDVETLSTASEVDDGLGGGRDEQTTDSLRRALVRDAMDLQRALAAA